MDHPYGWLCLIPPLLAILLAITTRRVLLSLLAGLFAGCLITAGGNLLVAVPDLLQQQLWATLVDESKLYVAFFTLLMGAMVGVINQNGGMNGLVKAVSKFARGRRSGQLTVWGLGLLIFFDDYANTILLGGALRPLCDRLKISREKLAYLVDSTAAPVAGLALVSTWVAGEISFVADGLANLPAAQSSGEEWNAADIFVKSLPYRFYVLWALCLVPIISALGRDFGPMRKAERLAMEKKTDGNNDENADGKKVASSWFATLPILVTVVVIVALLIQSGLAGIDSAAPSWGEIFGNADAYGSLLYGALAGLVTAVIMTLAGRLCTMNEVSTSAQHGAALMLPALAILWLASAMSTQTGGDPLPSDDLVQAKTIIATMEASEADRDEIAKRLIDTGVSHQAIQSAWIEAGYEEATLVNGDIVIQAYPERSYRLYTGDYLAALLNDRLSPALLPTLIFLLASGIAFATGTSWGTMGIVMPLAIPLTYSAIHGSGVEVSPDHPIFLAAIGSVLAGAIFGDHCSPISDTTVLSSQASGCDHIAHVWTQLPYALVVGGLSIVCGLLPLGFGAPVWVLLPLGCGALLACVWIFGRSPDLAVDRRDE